jgi:putative DNA-invertase from lambdoid prophage Rac
MAVFGYTRVSTSDQNPENQKLEIEQSGFKIDYWFSDHGVSGSIQASDRPQFKALLEKIRDKDHDTLVVSKLDRLGRDAIDVSKTVKRLQALNVKVIVLSLGGTDLTSPAGKMLMTMLSAVAEMERDLLIERTQAGLARAKAEGKKLGRKPKTTDDQKIFIRGLLSDGASVSQVARDFNVSRATVIAIRDGVAHYTTKP